MPKETIYSAYAELDDEPTIRIGWSRDGEHVELATVMPDSFELEPTPEGNGWFITLDRAGCNRLIKVIRTARDQAYGKDE